MLTENYRCQGKHAAYGTEAGDTLIEILISMLILSITVVSLLVAFSTAFSSSATHRNLAVTDTVLRSVAEQVYSSFQQTSTPMFAPCPTATATYYNSELTTALQTPTPYTSTYSASITSVYYWSGSNFSLTSSTCTSGTTVPQELTVQVLGPKGRAESVALVISGSGQIIVAPSVQLNVPNAASLTALPSTIGALALTYSGSSNAPTSQTYTAKACVDSSMSLHCTLVASYLSGANIVGLVPGTSYYVTVTADASTGYLSAASSSLTSVSSGSSTSPAVTSVAPSTTQSGSVVVTFIGITNPQNGQTYSATACTDSAMTLNCVSQASFVSGTAIGGLGAGTRYYVTISANANGSTPASTSIVSSPAILATVQLNAPSSVVATPSTSASGVIDVAFAAAANAPSRQIYTATACTNSAMSSGCVTIGSFTSGAQVAGLIADATYYVTLSANTSSGYLAATSSVTNGVDATAALAAPSISSTTSGSTGTASINFVGSSNAPSGQTYEAIICTSSTMTLGCRTVSSYTSGTIITALTSGATYYVTISANASTGFLAATSTVKSVSVK